jgi:AcrR family transcriptional regulator
LSDAAVHYHFHSKQELLSAVLESEAALAGNAVRHPGVCVTRECLIECLLAYFFSYVRLPGLIRMLLRGQIVNEPTSVASGDRIANRFPKALGPAFRYIYGERGQLLQDALEMLLSGVLWDEILEDGDAFPGVVSSSSFHDRVRGLIELVLPLQCSPTGMVQ